MGRKYFIQNQTLAGGNRNFFSESRQFWTTKISCIATIFIKTEIKLVEAKNCQVISTIKQPKIDLNVKKLEVTKCEKLKSVFYVKIILMQIHHNLESIQGTDYKFQTFMQMDSFGNFLGIIKNRVNPPKMLRVGKVVVEKYLMWVLSLFILLA